MFADLPVFPGFHRIELFFIFQACPMREDLSVNIKRTNWIIVRKGPRLGLGF